MKLPSYIRGLMDLFSTGKRIGITLGVLGVAIITISIISSATSHLNSFDYTGPIVTANGWLYIGIVLVVLAILAYIGEARYVARRQEIEGQERLRSAEDKLTDSLKTGSAADAGSMGSTSPKRSADDVLALSALWGLTNARLDEYHRIATGQAKRSFATAQGAIVVGFLVLIGFAVLSFRTHSTTASITTAALGAVAAALAGYISRTFVRSQETSARHLHSYFDQPLEFSRYLAAERLLSSQSDTKPEVKDALLQIIIKGMVDQAGAGNASDPDIWASLGELLETRDQARGPDRQK